MSPGNQFEMLIVLTIVNRISFTWSTNGFDSSSSEVSPISPEDDPTSITRFMARTKSFVSNWKELREALRMFGFKFQLLNKEGIITGLQLKATSSFHIAGESLYGILRLEMLYQVGDQTLPMSALIKLPQLGKLYHSGRKLLLYDKEKYMYESVLPIMFVSWPREILTPDFYIRTNGGTWVMEDVYSEFYTTGGDPHHHLHDVKLSTLVLKSLAEFHALSLTQVPSVVVDQLDRLTVTGEGYMPGDRFAVAFLRKFKAHVLHSLPFNMKTELRNMLHNLRSVLKSAYSPNTEGLNVILHGDPSWATTLFQNEHNTPLKCKFVDFHSSRRGSPVIDLINYLMTSVRFELLMDTHDVFLHYYIDELRKVLSQLRADFVEYNFEDMSADIRKYKLYFVFRLNVIVPQHWTPFARINTSEEEEDVYDTLFKSQEYLSFFMYWMRLLENY